MSKEPGILVDRIGRSDMHRYSPLISLILRLKLTSEQENQGEGGFHYSKIVLCSKPFNL